MTNDNERPKVIFLDAVGTLFGVRGSVGEVYGEIASRYDVRIAPELINQAFYKSFKASPPAAFPDVEPAQIPEREFAWWKAIAGQTFKTAGVFNQFSDFDAFFTEAFAYFATDQAWFLYPDVLPALKSWHQKKIELGIISNFDSRLHTVLKVLKLEHFFTSVTISTEVGAAKPHPHIFVAGLQKHHCPAEAAWHIGDSFKEDYQGAKAVGLQAIWVKRE